MKELELGLVYGSVRPGRVCDQVASWAAQQVARRGGFSVDLIDPRDMDLPASHLTPVPPDVADLKRRIDQADAFLIVTPEYNHGYPAILKTLIDSAYREWRAKPVAFVSYGGNAGGVRAVEQLRLVFAELHVVTMRDALSFANARGSFDETGRPSGADAAEAAMAVMLSHLHWWGSLLRDGRRSPSFGELAA